MDKQKKDVLEEFIKNNRQAFDSEPPPSFMWENIAKEISETKPELTVVKNEAPKVEKQSRGVLIPMWVLQAAAACILLCIGVFVGMKMNTTTPSQNMANTQIDVQEKIASLELRYKKELEKRLDMVSSFDPTPELQHELAEMRNVSYTNSLDLSSAGTSNEKAIIEAMAKEYQAKLEALAHVLKRLESIEKSKIGKPSHSKIRREHKQL